MHHMHKILHMKWWQNMLNELIQENLKSLACMIYSVNVTVNILAPAITESVLLKKGLSKRYTKSKAIPVQNLKKKKTKTEEKSAGRHYWRMDSCSSSSNCNNVSFPFKSKDVSY